MYMYPSIVDEAYEHWNVIIILNKNFVFLTYCLIVQSFVFPHLTDDGLSTPAIVIPLVVVLLLGVGVVVFSVICWRCRQLREWTVTCISKCEL